MKILSPKDEITVRNIFTSGVILLVVWSLFVLLYSYFSNSSATGIFTMIVTHLVSGRAGGISVGLEFGLPSWLIVLNSTAIDSLIVLFLYPVFVLSYKRTLKSGLFQNILKKSISVANKNEKNIGKYGILGLLLFVWFPLHMTGPLAGSILGFLIGIPPLKTIVIVLSGTFLAVLSWLFLFRQLFEMMSSDFSIFIPAAVIFTSGAMFLYYKFGKK